ncbi:unnamed protein product [Arctogadus glacialis]
MNTTFALRRNHFIVENPSQPISELLRNIFRTYGLLEDVDVNSRQKITLQALLIFLREDAAGFFKNRNIRI